MKLPHKLPNGRFAPYTPATELEIERAIQCSSRLQVPKRLSNDWRHWTLEQRAAFVARLKAHLGWTDPRPQGEYRGGVTPWVYGTPEAHAIADAANDGKPSRQHIFQLRLRATGVLFEGAIYHWNCGTSGYEISRWLNHDKQESLHRMLWERHHGPLLRGQVVRHADGNKNNFEISNLVLITRNDLARENQAASLQRVAREKTDAILDRHRRTGPKLELR